MTWWRWSSPRRAALPGLDLLGVPQADRRAPHPRARRRRARPPADEADRPAAAPAASRPAGARWPGSSAPGSSAACWSSPRPGLVTGLVVAVVARRRRHAPGRWRWSAVLGARGRVGWLGDVLRRRGGRAWSAPTLRRRLRRGRARRRAAGGRPRRASSRCSPPGASRAAEPYLTRYLPGAGAGRACCRRSPSSRSPPRTCSARSSCWPRCRWCPCSGPWSGWPPATGPDEQWRAMASLSGHFLDVMRGLPTLVAFRRARAQSAADRARSPTATAAPAWRPCGSPSPPRRCSSWWPRCRSRWSRSPSGSGSPAATLDLHTALVVLLLAPEAYWPLRRVGAEFHAAAEGVATFEKVSTP